MRFSGVLRVAVTGSTNDDIARLLGKPEALGLTIAADYQQRGSGRKGRAWIAPPGSALLFTTALPEPIASADLWIVPFWSALVVSAALEAHGIAVTLQWPNDVLLGKRKIAGILCISRISGDTAWAGCGIGINVTRPADAAGAAALAEIEPPPAFCDDRAPVARDALLATILERFDAMYDLLRTPQHVARRWEEAARIPGTPYTFVLDGETAPFEAEPLRLATGGALIVRYDGAQREIALADARVMR